MDQTRSDFFHSDYFHSEYFGVLLSMFLEEFQATYKDLPSKHKTKLLPYIMCFYRRWYYSALIENTIITPANLYDVFQKPAKAMVTPYFPKKPGIRSVAFIQTPYSLDNHPVVEDLKALLSFCTPTASLDVESHLIIGDAHSLLERLSIYDPFYADYLTDLAMSLRLLKKIPSIHSIQVQSADKAIDKLFSQSPREVLEQIVEASVDIATANIIGVLPVSIKSLNRDYIMTILRNPKDTDTIFGELYSAIGVDIQSFFDMEDDGGLNDIYNAMMSGTFYLGVMLDKYFYTIFGFYLKLINPGYVIPSDIKGELEYALEAFQYSDDISMGLFSPCSHYWLTQMGNEYFSATKTKDELAHLREIPPPLLMEMVRKGIQMGKQGTRPSKDGFGIKEGDSSEENSYELKIRPICNKNYWKNIEFPESMSLHDIFVCLCYEFGCDITTDYSFFPDTDANVFTAYTSPQNKRKSKKADKSFLTDLQLSEKSKFLFVLYDLINPYAEEVVPVKELRFELEVLKIKPCSFNKHYPYVSRISQAFKDFEFYDEW